MRANERAAVDVVRGVAATALRPPKPNEHRFFDAIPADWVDAERATTAERARLDEEEKHVHRRPHWVRAYDDKDVAARMHITLHSIAPESFGWDLSAEAQVEAADCRQDARRRILFAQERFEQAKRKFKRAVSLTEQALRVVPGDDPLQAQASEIALSCHLNIAACLLKLKEYTNVLEATNHALKIDAEQRQGAVSSRAGARAAAQMGRGRRSCCSPRRTSSRATRRCATRSSR
jgi:tetratricopeptide (TPR) repeat protein